ncbi:hypothetical protein [Paenibacillus sp.]|uniref:hypothetical protein n=1 Tax=Paenibacillus sp. TaxID=58172 RepID=UPI00281151EB|nr:hypothetical protein [Paenibacillus sp.]
MTKHSEEAEAEVTPKFLLENLLSAVDEQSIESVAYVARTKDGLITSGWTDMLYTEAIGLFEVGKLQAVKEM